MATAEWSNIRAAIDVLPVRKLVLVGKALRLQQGHNGLGFDYQKLDKSKLATKIRGFAYDLAAGGSSSEHHATFQGTDSTFKANAYAMVLRVIEAALAGDTGGDEAAETDSASETGGDLLGGAAVAAPTKRRRRGASVGATDKAARLAELLALLEGGEGGDGLSADEVRAIVRAELAAIPPAVIEVRRDGDLIGRADGLQHKALHSVLKAASARHTNGFAPNIWLSGPTGSGKTHLVEQVCKTMGYSFRYNGALSMSHEVLGFRDAAGNFHDTALTETFRNGGGYLFDEVDGCEGNGPLLALSAALSNGYCSTPDGIIQRHKDSVIFAAGNTWGQGATADYVGRARLDAAFLARFPVKITVDYDTDLELAISGNPDWARRVIAARGKARAAGLKVVISPRDSIAGAALIAAGHTTDEAAGLTYLAALTPDQRRLVEA